MSTTSWTHEYCNMHNCTKTNGVQDDFRQLPIPDLFSISCLIGLTLFSYIFYKKIIIPYDHREYPSMAKQSKRDGVNILRRLRRVGEKLPPPFPNGWFCIAESKEVKKGRVKEVHCLGESFAVFRGDSGEVHVLDAHCPHLGANMAVGGVVSGNCIECPFHKWKFSGETGDLISIPNLETIPKNIHVKKWKSREMNDMIMVWHHAEDIEPTYEIPAVEEILKGDLTPMARNEYYISCHIQDIPENGADVAHLNALHGDNLMGGMQFPTNSKWNIIGTHEWKGKWEVAEDPREANVQLQHKIMLFDKIDWICMDVEARQIGPSYVQMKLQHQYTSMYILQYVTPVAPLLQKVVHTLYCSLPMKPLANLIMWAETVMFNRDVMVWNSKEYAHNPVLVKTDKSIKAYRNWYKQFYSERSRSFEDAVTSNYESSASW